MDPSANMWELARPFRSATSTEGWRFEVSLLGVDRGKRCVMTRDMVIKCQDVYTLFHPKWDSRGKSLSIIKVPFHLPRTL